MRRFSSEEQAAIIESEEFDGLLAAVAEMARSQENLSHLSKAVSELALLSGQEEETPDPATAEALEKLGRLLDELSAARRV